MIKSLIKISFFVVNACHVVMKYDLKSRHFACNTFSFLQPLLSLINIAIFGVPHPNRIDNLKQLFLFERDHTTKLLLFVLKCIVFDDKFFDLVPYFVPFLRNTIFNHNLYY